MPYATPQDLIDRLGVREATMLSDRNHTGAPDMVELARALGDAQDVVNSFVGRRYALPLFTRGGAPAATPSILVNLVIDIARYRSTGTEIMETETIRNRHKDALALLEKIAKGEVLLGDGNLQLAAAGGAAPVGGSFAVRTGSKTFGDLGGVL